MTEVARVYDLAFRTCRVCGVEKPRAEFTLDRGYPRPMCKACMAADSRKRYAAHAEQRRAAERARREASKAADPAAWKKREGDRKRAQRKSDPIAYTLSRLRGAAKAKGIPFDLTRDDIFVPEFCPVLGIRLRPLVAGRGDDCPEADRLDPRLGYVRGNVTFISHRANRIKDDGSAEEHERIAAWMRSRGGR